MTTKDALWLGIQCIEAYHDDVMEAVIATSLLMDQIHTLDAQAAIPGELVSKK